MHNPGSMYLSRLKDAKKNRILETIVLVFLLFSEEKLLPALGTVKGPCGLDYWPQSQQLPVWATAIFYFSFHCTPQRETEKVNVGTERPRFLSVCCRPLSPKSVPMRWLHSGQCSKCAEKALLGEGSPACCPSGSVQKGCSSFSHRLRASGINCLLTGAGKFVGWPLA